jgi:hypothetical protein
VGGGRGVRDEEAGLSGCAGCSDAAAEVSPQFEQFWPRGMPFPPTAPWLAGLASREGVFASVSSGTSAASGRTSSGDCSVVDWNAARSPGECSNLAGALLMDAIGYMICACWCESQGGEVENYEFDVDACRVSACGCRVSSPPRGPMPSPPRLPAPRDVDPGWWGRGGDGDGGGGDEAPKGSELDAEHG